MNKKTVLTVGLACNIGIVLGALAYRRGVRRRIKEIQPILISVLADLILKAAEGSLSRDEILAHLDQDLDFMNIVLK